MSPATVIVMSQVPGSVTTVSVDNTDYVTAGTLLVQLDKRDAGLALEKHRLRWQTVSARHISR